MAAVSPFRGWRYNQETVGDMASVLCPPYDMINEENQEALKRQNQYNVIHLEAGEGLDWNTSAKEQYSATSNLFDRWRRDGVLQQDESPSYYLMRHSFPLCGKNMVRVGLIASVGLEDYAARQVLPHEFTQAPAIQDRVWLMESLSANISPIMSIYRDADGELDRVYHEIMIGAPEFDATDESGGATALWRITDPAVQSQIGEFFASRPIYLADGHHRYEAARQYQLDRHAESNAAKAPNLAHNFVMMTLIAFDDPGLVVLGYHRTLNGVPADKLANIKAKLSELFDSETLTGNSDALVEQVDRLGANQRLLASVDSGGAAMLTLKESAVEPSWGALATSEAWVLEEQVLRPELGDATLDHLDFMHDHEEAVAQAESGELQMVFLLKPFPLDAFESIVGGGQRLPRKSTFFFPKLPTGLVINRLEGEL
ncbi:MAG: DUF1015 domain-containing protein [SAR202 cluster bacterium]|nr:DUF1015 domain-containing protein [Dehalococcoidia bacterium]MQG13074.1 DUF1015 domain-containing protein [SAR202 cluster bacterium]MQG45801.1 DUF1015 domain-containing protein [SAR202 cluster bacterium]MQG61417.1 DUF1015 domain-containing protein [SAR202 cluster bacterium]MQG63998.1 DUF1015 domain-containing protein [SAR202 cluster bacterium]